VEHTVLPPGAAVWDSGLLEAGGRFRQVLTTPGEYTYVSVLHEAGGMIGHITVR
jgi:plastocyanin